MISNLHVEIILKVLKDQILLKLFKNFSNRKIKILIFTKIKHGILGELYPKSNHND